MGRFRLGKGKNVCPECGRPMYADIDADGNYHGLSCMFVGCKEHDVTKKGWSFP